MVAKERVMKKIIKYSILSLILVCLICGAVYKFVPFNIAKRLGIYDNEVAYIVPYSSESVKISGQGCDEVAALLNGLKGTPFSRKGIIGAAPEQFVNIVYTDGSYSRWHIGGGWVAVNADGKWNDYKTKEDDVLARINAILGYSR